MKVLQINSVCGLGSTGRIAIDIDSLLKERGIESYIAYGRNTSISNEYILPIGNQLDYYIHGGLTRIFDFHGLWGSKNATKRFVNQLKILNPDIIHLHNLHGYYINIKILFEYLQTAKKPVVWTLHDCWSFTGHCAHFSFAKCNRWIEGCYNCPQKASYPTSFLLDNSKANYRNKKALFTSLDNLTIITPSQWLANLVGQSFLAEYPVKVIHNGIDTKVFKPVNTEHVRQKYELGNKFIILGVASIWGLRKGLKYFIELAGMIDDNSLIVLVGLNDQQIKDLPQNIIGIKRTSDISELAQLYSAADVFVNPSVEETFGLVTAEAMACGTPAIVFDCTPGVEIVDNGCGYVAEAGIIGDLKRFIDQVKISGKNAYSEKCVNRVEKLFEKKNCFKEYIELYHSLGQSGGKIFESTFFRLPF